MPTQARIRARRSGLAVAILSAAIACGLALLPQNILSPTAFASSDPVHLDDPDQACAACHKDIYDRYRTTSMARGSGVATDALVPGEFHHAASNIDYRIFTRDSADWMSYVRRATAEPLSGERRLELFIGSGHRGRTYLYNQDGLWFELPINYYTRRQGYAMAPAFDNTTHMPAALPVDPNCLHCHATQIQTSLPEARNRFADLPFRQGGVGCSSCHGDPAQHLAANGHGPIINPAKLSPARRDSVCLQCHLEGDAVVYRPGKSLASFHPGEALDDTAVYFVKASQQGGGARATSQYEALLRSACKRASGDRLTCTTCHDPHFSPAPEQRVQYFRQRCLACHTSPAMASHHPEQPDCATCHMPSRNTSDISHEQLTDHDIEARPANALSLQLKSLGADSELVPVGATSAGDRELGLAYAQLALHGNQDAARRALTLLTKAAPSYPDDPELNTRLGFLQQISGDIAAARESYLRALKTNPYEPTALADLAVLDAAHGDALHAITLLEKLTAADPSQTSAALNLAFLDCKLNRREVALDVLKRAALFNPDDPQLQRFRASGDYGGQHCDLKSEPPASQ